jgi:hypothetical protein
VYLLSTLLIVTTIPAGLVLAEPEKPAPVEQTLERLGDVLARLEAELAALEAPPAERLEEGLERIIELIEALLEDSDRPQEANAPDAFGGRLVKLDLMLHRLLYVLDEIVENATKPPARSGAKGAVDDLRGWIDGYIEGATAGLDPRIADRLEKAAHEMVRDVAKRIADMAERARPDDRGRPVLARLVERLEDLLFKLDGFILRHADRPPRCPDV